MSEQTSERISLGSLVALLLAFYVTLELVSPFYFLHDDNSTFFLPVYVHNYRVLVTDGELAQANFHQYSGLPHLAAAQTAVLYPPVYAAVGSAIHVLGDVRYTIDLLVIVHLLIGGVGMYGLARYGQIPPHRAAWVGAVWATLPFTLIVARCWVFVAYLAAYLPLHLLLLLWLLEAPCRLRRVVALSVLKAVYITTGYVQYFVLASFFEALFLACRWFVIRKPDQEWWSELRAMVASTTLVCGLAAPLILPVWEAKSLSEERATALPMEEILCNSMALVDFVRAQFMWTRPDAIFESGTAIFFLGIPVLVTGCWLAMRLWQRDDRPQTRLMITCALVGLAGLAFSTSLYRLLCFSRLMATFRWPFKSVVFAAFFLLLASGLAWEKKWRSIRWSVPLLAYLLVSQVYLVTSPESGRPFAQYQLSRSVPELKITPAYRLTAGAARVATLAPRADETESVEGMECGEAIMGFQYATLGDRFHFAGYDPLVPSRQSEVARGVNHSAQIHEPVTRGLLDHLAARSVRWILVPSHSPHAGTLARIPDVKLIDQDGIASLFELTSARSLAWMEIQGPDGKRGTIDLPCRWHGNYVAVDTQGKAGQVTVNLVYHPAYKLYAGDNFLGVPAETPEHRVQFSSRGETRRICLRFEDTSFQRGLELAWLTGLLALGLWMLRDTRRLRSRSPRDFVSVPQALSAESESL